MRYVSVTWSCMWLCLWLVTCDWLCSCRCSFAKRPRRSKKDRQETPRWLRYHQHGVEKSSTWAKMGPRMAGQEAHWCQDEAKEIMALSGSDNIHNQFSRGFHVNVAVCLYDISFNTLVFWLALQGSITRSWELITASVVHGAEVSLSCSATKQLRRTSTVCA